MRPFFFFFIVFLCLSSLVSAFEDGEGDAFLDTSTYNLSLVYDDRTRTLSLPHGTTTMYVPQNDFVPVMGAFESPFLGILVGFSGKEYQRFGIDLPRKVLTGQVTTYTVPAPYHPQGERIDVYQGASKLFSVDISASRTCITDGMCRADVGENLSNCPVDCHIESVPPPPLPSATPVPSTVPGMSPPGPVEQMPPPVLPETTRSFFLPGVFFLLGLGAFGVWVYQERKG